MGDRRMAEIKTEDGSFYVYSHWSGYSMPELAADAIKFAQPRWTDVTYAPRIIVDQLTKQGRDDVLSWGLMLKPHAEDEYNGDTPSIVIDLVRQELTVVSPTDNGATLRVTTFADIAADKFEVGH
jgi:hypothetical protein